MNWDVSIMMDTGGAQHAWIAEVGNMTFNVAPMYYKAITGQRPHPTDPERTIGGLRYLDGMQCADALKLVSAAEAWMEAHWEECVALNPTNGWGNAEGALEFLVKIKRACRDHPKAYIKIT